ncbi:hypothetical protein VTJ04DRAFT_10789 [Mycothermus thermophilus]|uniref:uncharacterized protein n=1 Tax=Humicola insolens TaxID=85995 RepID=UPI0037437E91
MESTSTHQPPESKQNESGTQPVDTQPYQALPVFAHLPADIFKELMTWFCDHCRDPHEEDVSHDMTQIAQDVQSLSNLSKTCRWMRDAVQPVLFHQFPFWLERDGKRHLREKLGRFVRTLVTRSDLCLSVRCLKYRMWMTTPDAWALFGNFGQALLSTRGQLGVGMDGYKMTSPVTYYSRLFFISARTSIWWISGLSEHCMS